MEIDDYERDGFYLAPPLLTAESLARVDARIDAVLRGEYATGVAPFGKAWGPSDDPFVLRKIDQSHLADPTIYELVSHPALGEWAARVTGAKRVTVWATQLLVKPPGGRDSGNVGWHQDHQYWQNLWEPQSQTFTAWVAIRDVAMDSGPMRFVRGSHRWGFLNRGDFFGTDNESLRAQIPLPDGAAWDEIPALLPAGAVSFHHRLTLHGSGPNTSPGERRSFAIHLCTEKARPLSGSTEYYVSHLDDPAYCPVIFG